VPFLRGFRPCFLLPRATEREYDIRAAHARDKAVRELPHG
jgi:hypothetical protein